MWWLVTRERERRRGDTDVGLPPEIVDVDDLDSAELRGLRDVFDEMALLADLHDSEAFTGWLRKLVARFDTELDSRARRRAELRAQIDAYRAEHPLGSVRGDTSHIPSWSATSGPEDPAETARSVAEACHRADDHDGGAA